MKAIHVLIYIPFLGCSQLPDYSTDGKGYINDDSKIACSPTNDLLDAKKNPTGHQSGAAGRSELHPIVDGFKVNPITGLGSWTMFTPDLDTAMVMGDIIITEKDFAMVDKEVAAAGLTITDIHKHPTRDRSVILFMHVKGFGNENALSVGVSELFGKLSRAFEQYRKSKVENANLNTAQLDSIIGFAGSREGGIYKYDLARLNVLKARGLQSRNSSEYNTWAAWQGTDQEASVTGDFMMLENEVTPVIKALAENGFELIHNQLVHEKPRIFCLHYWGVGNSVNLAKGLQAAFAEQEK